MQHQRQHQTSNELLPEQHYVIATTTAKLQENLDLLARERRPVVSVQWLGGRDWVVIGGPHVPRPLTYGDTVSFPAYTYSGVNSSGSSAVAAGGERDRLREFVSKIRELQAAHQSQVTMADRVVREARVSKELRDALDVLYTTDLQKHDPVDTSDLVTDVAVARDSGADSPNDLVTFTMAVPAGEYVNLELPPEVVAKLVSALRVPHALHGAVCTLDFPHECEHGWVADQDRRHQPFDDAVPGDADPWTTLTPAGDLDLRALKVLPEVEFGDIRYGRYDEHRFPKGHNFTGWVEDRARSWIVFFGAYGSPALYWPRRDEEGGVVGEPVDLTRA